MLHKNLSGRLLRITTRYDSVYTYDVQIAKVEGKSGYMFKGGYAADTFLLLQTLLGFTYTFVPDVGTYNFSLAVEKQIDLFVASYSLYYSRARLVDPTFVTGNSRIIAILDQGHVNNVRNLFLLPFSRSIWIAIFLVFCTSFLLVSFICRLENHSWKDALFTTVAVALQKELSLSSVAVSFRITFFTISALSVVLIASYAGTMFSMKTVSRSAIQSVESLVQSSYTILLELGHSNSSIRLMLENLNHLPVIRHLLHSITSASYTYTSFEDAILEVANKPTAYIIDEETGMTTIKKVLGSPPCDWSAISVLELKYPWSMFMRKGSEFKESINYGLLKIDETGLRHRLKKAWIPHTSKCIPTSLVSFTPVNVIQTHAAFLLVGIGILIAYAQVVLERKVVQTNIRKSSFDSSSN